MRPSSMTLAIAWDALVLLLLLSCSPSARPLAPYPSAAPPTRSRPVVQEAPPVSLTASDGTGLELATLEARAVIEDPLAFTELELSFDNPNDHTVEGRFEILLPQGAQVTRFAMEIHGRWQEAEVVEKHYARRAYEAILHEQRDPALLERATGNRFRARVFPIAANERKRLILSYVETLPDPAQPYRLALRGLPWLEELDARVLVDDRTEEHHLRAEPPMRDWVVPRHAPSQAGLRHGEHVIARVEVLAGVASGDTRPFSRLTVLFDTSASRALDYDQRVEGFGRLLHALSRHAGTAQLEILAFDQEVVPIYEGGLGSVGQAPLAALHARRPLGASNLGAALGAVVDSDHRPDRVLLVTDGLISAGTESDARLRRLLTKLARKGVERIDVVRVGEVRDDARLRRLVTGPLPESGVLLDLERDLDRSAERMVLPTMDGLRIDIPGARWWSPRKIDGLQPGDHVLIQAELPEARAMVVQVSGPVHLEHTIELREVNSPLVDHAWMHGKIEGLVERIATLEDALESESLRRLAVSLSVRHRIFNDFTAFLVLETDEDYARFGLDRRALGDILVVGPKGVEIESRGAREEVETPDPPEIPSEPAPPPRIGSGQISGQVIDERDGKPIQGAIVLLQCPCFDEHREATTNAGGLYGFGMLPEGTYTIQVLMGTADVSKITELPTGARFRANFRLDPRQQFRRMISVQRRGAGLGDRRRDRRERRRETTDEPSEPPVRPPTQMRPPLPLPPPPPTEPTELAIQEQTTSTEEVHYMPVGSSISREFTVVVDTSSTASRDSAGITLAGTTGAESMYVVEGANVNDPAFGTIGASGTYGANMGPRFASVIIRQINVRGDGLARHDARVSVREQQNAIEHCYFRTLKDEPRVHGRVRVRLRVDSSGHVEAVLAQRQLGLRNDDLLLCLDEALREATFPVRGDHRPQVLATLIFQPGDGPPNYYYVDYEESEAPPDPTPNHATLAEIDADLATEHVDRAWARAWAWRQAAPSDVLALVALGRVAEARGKLGLAARAYGSILDLFPSRADMRRFAAGQLEALDEAALALAVDAYRKAVEQRPDHPSSHRGLAFALVHQGRLRAAFEVLEGALSRSYPPGRFAGVDRVLREDLGIVAAAWRRDRPQDAAEITSRLAPRGATLAEVPSLRFVLTWESDANDVDLHVESSAGELPAGGELFADVDNGFGPECLAISNPDRQSPYRILVHYFDRGPMGYGLGKVQIMHHDGLGGITLDDRPFVIVDDGATVDLGFVRPRAP